MTVAASAYTTVALLSVTGGTGNDTITADAGNDTINGGAGDDIINGGNGSDNITGGAGADTLSGGFFADTFVYTTLTDSKVTGTDATKAGIDWIQDFDAGNGDQIDVGTLPTFVKTYSEAWNTDWDTTISTAYASAIEGSMTANDVLILTVTIGSNAGTYMIINDGTAGWSAAADAVIEITGVTNLPITTDNFA